MPAKKKKTVNYFVSPQVSKYGDCEVLKFTGKDARGYDFAVELFPLDAIAHMGQKAEKADADRVNMYVGGNPDDIKDIGTEVEITLGEKGETHRIDRAAMVYIPKGTPHRCRLARRPSADAWLLSLTLPPKYVEPETGEENKV
ncbi:MAG: hypothetical protein N2506_01575 [Dehalococcoidales bacterium]|nr:hypothetical protein [Dehalococcoidales bacterium]